MIGDDPTWDGLCAGMLVLAVTWWAWVAYSWLTNTVDLEEDARRRRHVRRDGGDVRRRAGDRRRSATTALVFGGAYFVVRAAPHR